MVLRSITRFDVDPYTGLEYRHHGGKRQSAQDYTDFSGDFVPFAHSTSRTPKQKKRIHGSINRCWEKQLKLAKDIYNEPSRHSIKQSSYLYPKKAAETDYEDDRFSDDENEFIPDRHASTSSHVSDSESHSSAILAVEADTYDGHFTIAQKALMEIFGDKFRPSIRFHATLCYTNESQLGRMLDTIDRAASTASVEDPCLIAKGKLEVFGTNFVGVNASVKGFDRLIEILKPHFPPRDQSPRGWSTQYHISLGKVTGMSREEISSMLTDHDSQLAEPYNTAITKIIALMAGRQYNFFIS